MACGNDREELEKFLMREMEARSSTTFIYRLHERDVFDKAKFRELISKMNELADCYAGGGGTENSGSIARSINDCFMYVMSRFYFHLASDDLSVIENYADISDEIPDFIEDMRNAMNKLIF